MFETGAAVFDLQPPLHVVLDILYLYSILYSTVQYSTVSFVRVPAMPAGVGGRTCGRGPGPIRVAFGLGTDLVLQ
jgi:hypothetical protein